MKPNGQIAYHGSRLDAELQPLALCATDGGPEPCPLIVEVSPGTITDLPGSAARCAEIVTHARAAGERCVVIKPGQRGPGTVGQGPGEVDVLEAIDWACNHYPVDRDRISLLGASMGGAAAWYLASHHPDLFAAAAPFCGYGGLDLWDKPGGPIMRTQAWERSSWEGRDAIYRAENLANTALWITHGAWDAAIGPGVPVAHSRRMVERLEELGSRPRYTEVEECGHGCMTDATLPPVVAWLCRQRRATSPDRVRLVAHTLRHNRAWWVTIDQLLACGTPATVDAQRTAAEVRVTTNNVRRLTIGPIPGSAILPLAVDTTRLGALDLSRAPVTLERGAGGWVAAGGSGAGEKVHACSGPMGDLFYEPQRFVFGGGDDAHEAFVLRWLSEHLPKYFRGGNGGVHRGVFPGESWYKLPITQDTELTDEELSSCNLVLFGAEAARGVLGRLGASPPVAVRQGGIEIAGRVFEGSDLGWLVVHPHPRRSDRYLALVGGTSPEALAGCSHLGLQLLPDWMVWQGTQVWWGHTDHAWRL